MQQSLLWLIAAAAISILTGLAGVWLLRQPKRPAPGPAALPTDWALLPRPVFTADERRLYRLLREALPHHMVLAKLPLVRFCQPADPAQVRYWYDLLGATQVGFVVCSANGRVLAAMDLAYESGGVPGRTTRIKQSVLGACRIRYLRCQADHLPSIPELQLLVPHNTTASRGPQPAQDSAALPGAFPGTAPGPQRGNATAKPATHSQPGPRRRERTTLWQESTAFSDSFFSTDRSLDASHDELSSPDAAGSLRPAMVADESSFKPPLRH